MKLKVLSIFICMSLIWVGTTVLAGNGSGDGGGQSKLELVEALVEKDLDHLLIDETIYLNFSNNVVNMKVKDINMTCFTLMTSEGEVAEFELFFGDDQVDREIRNTIEIRPASEWLEGTSYQLTISGDLTSKNGMSLGEEITVEFTTESTTESEENPSQIVTAVGILGVSLMGGFFIGRKRRNSTK